MESLPLCLCSAACTPQRLRKLEISVRSFEMLKTSAQLTYNIEKPLRPSPARRHLHTKSPTNRNPYSARFGTPKYPPYLVLAQPKSRGNTPHAQILILLHASTPSTSVQLDPALPPDSHGILKVHALRSSAADAPRLEPTGLTRPHLWLPQLKSASSTQDQCKKCALESFGSKACGCLLRSLLNFFRGSTMESYHVTLTT